MENQFGIYIHVPFCARRCGYCDFYSIENTALVRPYVKALKKQIRSVSRDYSDRTVDTIYMGGGTPSLLEPGYIKEIFSEIRKRFKTAPDAEATLECNPNSVTPEKAAGWREAGANRVSLGAQSFNGRELAFLHRLHTETDVYGALNCLRQAGFKNINLDLLFGIPGQTMDAFTQNLALAAELDVQHLSVYGLTIEKNTPLYARLEKKEFRKTNDETYEAMFLTAHAVLERKGFAHYEISNYAKPGMEARHNINCWQGRDYLGFGPSAHSRVGSRRWAAKDDTAGYIDNPLASAFDHTLDQNEQRLEKIMLGLRTSGGIDVNECAIKRNIDPLREKGYIESKGGRVALTPQGMLFLDSVILYMEDKRCSISNGFGSNLTL